MKKNIAILGTLDTKREEVVFIKGIIESRGYSTTVIDVGPLGPPLDEPDVSNEKVAKWAGRELPELLRFGLRDQIMESMGEGASRVLLNLFKDGRMDGVIGMGGNQGTAIASMGMKVLPIGFPKFIVSTVASGDIRPYVGYKDIGMMFSVADLIGGPNSVTRPILVNAVSALLGMVEDGERISLQKGEKKIAISALGNTQPAVDHAMELLQEKGFQVIAFHASGAGGSAMEELIEERVFHGVLDLTPHELTEEVVEAGVYVPIRPGRLTSAGRLGIPQVVSLGGMEYLCFGPKESIPFKLRRRRIHMHNPYNANVKLSRSEMAKVGKAMANRLNEANGPSAVLVPLRGWSVYGAEGGPFHDSKAYEIFVQVLRSNLKKSIQFEEIDAQINDPLFVNSCVKILLNFIGGEKS